MTDQATPEIHNTYYIFLASPGDMNDERQMVRDFFKHYNQNYANRYNLELIRNRTMPRSRYRISNNTAPHFLTATVNHWLPIFTRTETVNIVLDSWRYLQQQAGMEIYAYVILENHLHLVATSDDLSHDMQRFKSYSAKRIINCLQQRREKGILEMLALFKRPHKTECTYQVWEEGNHPQLIESEQVMRQKIDYIHQNPVKRGYVDLPEHWRYSSARDYAGMDGLIEVKKVW